MHCFKEETLSSVSALYSKYIFNIQHYFLKVLCMDDICIKRSGPGRNSSKSKNVGKIQLSMQLLHSSIIFEIIWLMIIPNSNFWHGSS